MNFLVKYDRKGGRLMPLFPHKSNLETKIKKNYGKEGKFFDNFYQKEYLPWLQKNTSLKAVEKKDVFTRTQWFIDYLKKVDSINVINRPEGKKEGWITTQSKFRPTVLEEFTYYVLKDIEEIQDLGLEFTNRAVFAGLTINPKGDIKISKKM